MLNNKIDMNLSDEEKEFYNKCTYNREKIVNFLVDDLMNQHFKNFKILNNNDKV
jgi:hypothetical protein